MVTISALITTHGRPNWLERCVRSLQQAAKNTPDCSLRIRICLNGPDPETLPLLQALSRESDGSVEFLVLDDPVSPSRARNLLLSGMREEWAYFIDDDAFVPPTHFREFTRILRELPAATAVGGPNLLPERSGTVQAASDVVLTSLAGTYRSSARYRPRGSSWRQCREESLILCNLFIKAEALGPEAFPEEFICAEENAVLHELARRQLGIIYAPTLFNWHERRPSIAQLFVQTFKYGRGRAQFLLRYPEGVKLAQLLPSVGVLFTIHALVSFKLKGQRPDAWLVLCLVYFGICVLSSRRKGPWWSPFLFPVVHSGYGMGLIHGLLFKPRP
ncbi:MAG: glycosyltransferase [Oligoflexia bacterium]|nr:glycosyltransferase [Oligoflexia bacterium]